MDKGIIGNKHFKDYLLYKINNLKCFFNIKAVNIFTTKSNYSSVFMGPIRFYVKQG